MIFRKAAADDRERVLLLYQSVIGEEFCVWNEYYPTMLEIDADIAGQSLYLLESEAGLVGAVSVVPENELDDRPEWHCRGRVREIARVAVSPLYRGHGYAGLMERKIADILRSEGVQAIHLMAAVGNLPAVSTYRKNGYRFLGECEMYGNRYYLCEKNLSAINL